MNRSSSIRRIIGSVVVCMAFGAGAAQAATVYVDVANSTGIEDGTTVAPFNTIQEGINAAVAGDKVLVSPGIYHGAIEMKNAVTVASDKGPKLTIIDGDGSETVVNPPYSLESRTTLDGFTVKNGSNLVYLTNRANFWSYSEIRITNCIFTNWLYKAITAMPASMAYVSQSVFSNPGATYPYNSAYDGIWCSGPQFTNVTIDQVGTAFTMYQIGTYLTNTTVSNATALAAVWGSRGTGYFSARYSNFFNITTEAQPGDSGQYPTIVKQNSLSVDPLFANASSTNYLLSPGSQLIDAGINVGLPFNGTAPDIGAYEANVSIPEMVEALAHSYQDVPLDAYKNAGEQRRHALNNKFIALLKQIDGIKDSQPRDQKLAAWQEALDKLLNDIWAKGDGFYGGNPKNDWITTQEEQARLYEKVQEIEAAIRVELARI